MNVTPELIISILALAGSAYAIWLTRKHHRLSFIPHLELPFDRHRTPEGTIFVLTLRNTGLGPAIIISRDYTVGNQPFVGKTSDPLEELVAKYLGGKVRYFVQKHGLPGVGSILPAGKEQCIYQVLIHGLKEADEPAIMTLLEGVEFEGKYRSMHGDTFPFSTRNAKISQKPN